MKTEDENDLVTSQSPEISVVDPGAHLDYYAFFNAPYCLPDLCFVLVSSCQQTMLWFDQSLGFLL